MNKNNGSASALVESGRGGLARSGSKFDLRDKVLIGICACPGFTINEIAVEYYDWYREPYKNAPKRARDLLKLGYIEQLDNRECRFTKKSGHTYQITDKGREYLRVNNKLPAAPVVAKPVTKPSVKPDFSGMKSVLG